VLPRGAVFPFNFGFIPATAAADGDPLDVLVLLDEPAFPGCKVLCRLIGVIEAKQRMEGGKVVRNDRLVAVAKECREDRGTRSLKNLPAPLLEEIEHFFASYHELEGTQFRPLARRGPTRAEKLVREGMERFRKSADGQGEPGRDGKAASKQG